jgi:hypothetical protein
MGTDILAGMSPGQFAASSRGSLPVGSMPGSNIYMTERNATVVDQMRHLKKIEAGGVANSTIRLVDGCGRVSMHHAFNMTPSELQRMKKYSASNSDERREEIESFDFSLL